TQKFFLLCPHLAQFIAQARQTHLLIHSIIISYFFFVRCCLNENSSLLYSLLVYDANDVQHQCYEDITIYPENYSKSNPICKTIPDGYVILKVKYAGENLTPCDFEITLSK
ncbi:hypothetical protein, partial [Hominenteromicrobium sp.]|uniref:hypothetical protein n=1 Tax=Hominenteromicrobium sp. TaxID=3073581 RepID=UPI003AB29E64